MAAEASRVDVLREISEQLPLRPVPEYNGVAEYFMHLYELQQGGEAVLSEAA